MFDVRRGLHNLSFLQLNIAATSESYTHLDDLKLRKFEVKILKQYEYEGFLRENVYLKCIYLALRKGTATFSSRSNNTFNAIIPKFPAHFRLRSRARFQNEAKFLTIKKKNNNNKNGSKINEIYLFRFVRWRLNVFEN